jgi:tetratricopeptide (TPR) repeat protein
MRFQRAANIVNGEHKKTALPNIAHEHLSLVILADPHGFTVRFGNTDFSMRSPPLRRTNRVASALIAMSVVLPLPGVAWGQSQEGDTPPAEDPTSLKRGLDELFDRILRDPSNVDLTLRYARVATQLGDYEAAVTALERLLFLNPSLAQAQLELGVLYYRLGSYGLARSYLDEAKTSGQLAPETLALVDGYLTDIAKLDNPHLLTGEVFAGMLHESNANLGPGSAAVPLPGGVGTLAPGFVKKSDQSLFTSGSVLYSYDLRDQDRTSLDVTGQLVASKHSRVHSFDLLYLESTFGPRSTLATWGLSGFVLHPYVIADYVLLGGSTLFHALGTGVEARKTLLPDLTATGTFEFRDKRYHASGGRLTAPDFSGNTHDFSVQLAYSLTASQRLSASAEFLDESTRSAAQSNRHYAGGLAYQIAYAPPGVSDAGKGSWQTIISGSRIIYDYQQADPTIDPNEKRFDREWRFSLLQLVPLTDAIALSLQLQRDVVSSSLPLFAYTNTSVVFGAQLRF